MVPTHFVRLLALPDEVKAKYDVSSMKLVDAHRRHVPGRREAGDDRVVRTDLPRRVRRHRGRHRLLDHERGVARTPGLGRPLDPTVRRARARRRRQRGRARTSRGGCSSATPPAAGIVYPNDPEKTAAAHIAPGLFTLGEIGYIDADGYVFITDRFSDMVVSGGANIYPAEAEQVLIEHPDVADVALHRRAARRDGRGAEGARRRRATRPHPRTRRSCRRSARAPVALQVPADVDVVADLGRNAMGKINKRTLRAPYWDGARTQIAGSN